MSNPNTAEEIARKYFHGFSDEQWKTKKDNFPYSTIPKIAQEHTAQTLDRLKESVSGLRVYGRVENMNEDCVKKSDILNLIEEVNDE